MCLFSPFVSSPRSKRGPLSDSFALVNGNAYRNSNRDHKYARAHAYMCERARIRVTFGACVPILSLSLFLPFLQLLSTRRCVRCNPCNCDASLARCIIRYMYMICTQKYRNILDVYVCSSFNCLIYLKK